MKLSLSNLLLRVGLAVASAPASAQGDAVEADLIAGRAVVVEAPSSDKQFGVVFEDDGDTGYFYALDFSVGDNPIQEAMSIYDIASVEDRGIPSRLTIRWSKDQRKAGLWINGYPHAIFDFSAKRGYSRRNFPGPLKWTLQDFSWDDAALDAFR